MKDVIRVKNAIYNLQTRTVRTCRSINEAKRLCRVRDNSVATKAPVGQFDEERA